MITDKDREEAGRFFKKVLMAIEPFTDEPALTMLCNEIARIRAESAEQARKEAAERAVEWFKTVFCVPESAKTKGLRAVIIGDHVKDGKTDSEKLAIAVKALEEILYRHGIEPGVAADCCHIANTALKEIQG